MQLSVLAKGMVTSVGYNAPKSCAAIRARITGIEEFYLSPSSGDKNRIYAGKVNLPQWWDHITKLVDLVSPAIFECLENIPKALHSQIPLLLGIALPEAQFIADYDKLIHLIERKLDTKFHSSSHIVEYGHTAGIVAIKEATKLFSQLPISYCIIAGADSYLFQKSIQYYVKKMRILTNKNQNGFLPGEAGSAILIAPTQLTPYTLMTIEGIGESEEKTSIYDETPFTAMGMTNAIRQALNKANITLDKVSQRLCDLNGEEYKFKEANIATMRFNDRTHIVQHDICHPIENTGEIGAAIIPLLLGLALDTRENDCHLGRYILLHASNDQRHRGALVLRYHRREAL